MERLVQISQGEATAQAGAGERRTTVEVVLVAMPFGPISQPSIGLSLLKAGLDRRHVSSEILYCNLLFARCLGPDLYNWPHRVMGQLQLGEWIFSNALYEHSEAEKDRYLALLRKDAPAHFGIAARDDGDTAREAVHKMLGELDGFIEESAHEICSRAPRLVGFTCLSQQLVPSLALARRLHERCPEIHIVLGGPSCDGVKGLEIVRQFPFVGSVVCGEGDIAFPQLVDRVLQGTSPAGIPGVYLAGSPDPQEVGWDPPRAAVSSSLDDLPIPDYDDFFEQLAASCFSTWADPAVLFETARGCWWGQARHCNYCSLNLREMKFRSKSPERMIDELCHLAAKYPGQHLQAVDNMLDMRYFRTVIPELARRRLGSTLFFEVPCTLDKRQIRVLRDAGVTRIQPGIESLSTPVLKLMNRPATQLSNVQLLKWCQELGVRAVWNILYGVPGESAEDYERGAELIPKLMHLYSPVYFGPFSMSRHSPYFEQAEEHGLCSIQPCPAYAHIFPFAEEALARLAHYFAYDYHEPQEVARYTAAMEEAWKEWFCGHTESDLFFIDRDGELAFLDLRPVAVEQLTVLSGVERALYLACDGICTKEQLRELAGTQLNRPVSRSEVEALVGPLLQRHLMIHEDGSYLALALPVGEYQPRLEDRWRLDILLHKRAAARQPGKEI